MENGVNPGRLRGRVSEPASRQIVVEVVAFALGFLGSFEKEITRFKDWVNALDRTVNPHRHEAPDEDAE